jgi:hypothetical protein
MSKPSTYFSGYLFSYLIYLYIRPISYRIGYQGETKD